MKKYYFEISETLCRISFDRTERGDRLILVKSDNRTICGPEADFMDKIVSVSEAGKYLLCDLAQSLASERLAQNLFLRILNLGNEGGNAFLLIIRNPRLTDRFLTNIFSERKEYWATFWPMRIARPHIRWSDNNQLLMAENHIRSFGCGYSARRGTFIPGLQFPLWMHTEDDLLALAFGKPYADAEVFNKNLICPPSQTMDSRGIMLQT